MSRLHAGNSGAEKVHDLEEASVGAERPASRPGDSMHCCDIVDLVKLGRPRLRECYNVRGTAQGCDLPVHLHTETWSLWPGRLECAAAGLTALRSAPAKPLGLAASAAAAIK